jgi:hypothetical protein
LTIFVCAVAFATFARDAAAQQTLFASQTVAGGQASPAGGQTNEKKPVFGRIASDAAEGAFGYSVTDRDDGLPVGWLVSLAALPTPWLAVVGQISGEYETVTSASGARTRQSTYTFLDGPRVTVPCCRGIKEYDSRGSFYGQLLFGIMHLRRSSVDSENDFAIQPGVGANIHISSRLSVRFQGGLSVVFTDDETTTALQFLSALAFGAKRK